MKKWKTVPIIIILASTLITAGVTTYSYLQPTHYEGTTFTNETTISNSTTSTSVSSSSKTVSASDSFSDSDTVYTESSQPELDQRGGTCMGQTPAQQPTFEVVYVSTVQGYCAVEHRPTGELIKAVNENDAYAFCNYMEQIAHGKETLDYTLQENYDYWLDNVKDEWYNLISKAGITM